MSKSHSSIILKQINDFIQASDLYNTISKLNDKSNKLIVLNNSFLFREKIKTKKNEKYISFIPDKIPVNENNCYIVSGPNLKSNYSIMALADDKIVTKEKLEDSINKELELLGEIIFVLMGEIDENTQLSEVIDHEIIKKVTYLPKEKNKVIVNNEEIILKELDNEKENWSNIEKQLETKKSFDQVKISDLKSKIGKAFDNLKKEAYLNLIIPNEFEKNKEYFLELITKSIEEQFKIYQEHVKKYATATTDRQYSLNEVLRISYNFVDDASTLIRLIVSVCDLKPIILWETYCYHFNLDESIRLLPWTKQVKKPSLADYIDTIKKARNKSFHRLIPFSKAFEVKLPENSIKKANLRIFSEYGSKSNRLEYEDKELVDVLMEFTRTSEEIVSDEFWDKNTRVIEATINLLKSIANTIRLLR